MTLEFHLNKKHSLGTEFELKIVDYPLDMFTFWQFKHTYKGFVSHFQVCQKSWRQHLQTFLLSLWFRIKLHWFTECEAFFLILLSREGLKQWNQCLFSILINLNRLIPPEFTKCYNKINKNVHLWGLTSLSSLSLLSFSFFSSFPFGFLLESSSSFAAISSINWKISMHQIFLSSFWKLLFKDAINHTICYLLWVLLSKN